MYFIKKPASVFRDLSFFCAILCSASLLSVSSPVHASFIFNEPKEPSVKILVPEGSLVNGLAVAHSENSVPSGAVAPLGVLIEKSALFDVVSEPTQSGGESRTAFIVALIVSEVLFIALVLFVVWKIKEYRSLRSRMKYVHNNIRRTKRW